VNLAEMNATNVSHSKVARRQCGRCGAGVKESDFCAACREYFRMLSARKVEFTELGGENHRIFVLREGQVKNLRCRVLRGNK